MCQHNTANRRPKDSLPPVLIEAMPHDSTLNFTGNRITLTFDEYVDVQNTFENVLVSPTPANLPVINNHLRTISIKLKDTLEPNTTYAINFGNAIKDVNEGNVTKNFTYLFSTGNTLDTNSLAGKVVLAETGKTDTTMVVVLHRNLDDSAVAKDRPRYIAKLDGKGNFMFRNLAAGTYALYAIPNEFAHQYNDSTKPFAFADEPVKPQDENKPVTLYAYELPKLDTVKKTAPATKGKQPEKDKKLQFQSSLQSGRQDALQNLELTFSKPIKTFDSTKIVLAGSDLQPVSGYTITEDTSRTHFIFLYKWPLGTEYKLLIEKTAFTDTAGVTLLKNDTVSFTTKKAEDYGSIRLRFKNLNFSKNPVLQIIQNDKIKESISLSGSEWFRKLYEPGEYDMRILYDENRNGIWDPGHFFGSHHQPEIAIFLNTKLTIRANWDNEKEIVL